MDELKKLIQSNRGAMDVDHPDPHSWSRLERELRPKGRVVSFSGLLAAACVIGVIGVSVLILLFDSSSKGFVAQSRDRIGNPVVAAPQVSSERKISTAIPLPEAPGKPLPYLRRKHVALLPNDKRHKGGVKGNPDDKLLSLSATALYTKAEAEYRNLITTQVSVVEAMPVYIENESYFASFKQGLASIARTEATLKADIAAEGFTTDMVKRLINVYTQKLKLLLALQEEIDKVNSKKKIIGIDSMAPVIHLKL